MIDYEKEKLISFPEAARWFADILGERIVHTTVANWARDGVGGARLDEVVIGAKRRTSIEACRRFIEARTLGLSEVSRTQIEQSEDALAAARELEELGV